jgi:metal-sulfur cluster biosynthetic enzyme
MEVANGVTMEVANGVTMENETQSIPTEDQILEAMKVVKDPEIPVNVVDLGLVYKTLVSEGGVVDIEMTLTSVGCPVQDMIRADVELALMRLEGVSAVNVDFVWTPPWTPAKMSEDGKRQMRMFGFSV